VEAKIIAETYLNVGQITALDSGNAPPVVEPNLPYPAKIGEQVLDAFSSLYIPHLQISVGS
jgi:hypothetical protein